MTRHVFPVAMGVMLGVMGMWMLHGQLTGQGAALGVGFIAAHVVVVALPAALLALGLGRKSPWLNRLARHRPSLHHLAILLAVAVLVAGLIHLVHGGPQWT